MYTKKTKRVQGSAKTSYKSERGRETAYHKHHLVGEDDVVSEMIPPPTAPCSSRKLSTFQLDASSSDESIVSDLETAQGYRLVSMKNLRKFVTRLHTHAPCASGEMKLFT